MTTRQRLKKLFKLADKIDWRAEAMAKQDRVFELEKAIRQLQQWRNDERKECQRLRHDNVCLEALLSKVTAPRIDGHDRAQSDWKQAQVADAKLPREADSDL